MPRAASSYMTRLDRTLKALQSRVKEQESVLEQVSGQHGFHILPNAAKAPCDHI
jgi:hypothetical protein